MAVMAGEHKRRDVLPPPVERYTVLGWLYKNLFSSWYNILLTGLSLGIIYIVLKPTLVWAFTKARWVSVALNMANLFVGVYPREELWRVWWAVYVLVALIGLSWGAHFRNHGRGVVFFSALALLGALPIELSVMDMQRESLLYLPLPAEFLPVGLVGAIAIAVGRFGAQHVRALVNYGWILYVPVVLLLIRGISPEHALLPLVRTSEWGGLMLNIIVSSTALVLGLPIGIALALGRRSQLPVMRTLCITFIEWIRGAPLIMWLFTAQVMLPLFLPPEIRVDKLIRAQVAVTMFAAAYSAEIVRGGLQAIPAGQYEAADALALTKAQSVRHIVLPQALRTVIPVFTNEAIGLSKDTSLLKIVGMHEMLSMATLVMSNPDFLGTQRELLFFAGVIFWIVTYAISYSGRRVERAQGLGRR